MDVVGLELFKGFGRLWLHPLTYIFFLTALWFGLKRVKRERKNFHTRVQDVIHEITFPLLIGIIFGLLLSIIFSVVGIEIPYGMLALIFIIWLLMLPFGNMRFLSMTTVVSLAFIVSLFLPDGGTGYALIDGWLKGISSLNAVGFAWIIAGLFFAEALIILFNGWEKTSPKLITSERGKTIGTHEAKRLWFLPVLLLIPVGNVSFEGFWPLFSSGDVAGNGFMFVPFIIGTQLAVQSEFPELGVQRIGKKLLLVSVAVIILTAVATVWPLFAPAVGLIGVIIREGLFVLHASHEKHRASIYTNQKEGLTVLGVLPFSTADKMGIQVGEVILKVNGCDVSSQRELYEALQLNSAFCKLEVLNREGEVHFLQSSIHEGDHHQIGLLFVPDGDMNLSASGLKYSTIIHRDRDVIRRTSITALEKESEMEENHGEGSEKVWSPATDKEEDELANIIQELENKETSKTKQTEEKGSSFVTSTENREFDKAWEVSDEEKKALQMLMKQEERTSPATSENDAEEELPFIMEEDPLELEVEEKDTSERVEISEVKITEEDAVPLTEENFQKELLAVKEMREKEVAERRAERGDRPYGQAAGLEAFYAEFQKAAKEKENWKDILELDHKKNNKDEND